MPLATGTRLGPYEVVSQAGAGGMGEVYRALDTRLDRTVAIKILPAHMSADPEAKQRFDREARAISSLNHPNICTLYDVGHQSGTDFLVMEFLEGETLADRLLKGPLPPEQVLRYGIEICEGLEKAHKTGVVHRDLKPGNIMLTKAGAKLMDFGLAKALTIGTAPASSLTMTVSGPSASQPLTARGMLVGTFQYMSPEQTEGVEADVRSDIFALGAVLYEMATGKRAFNGKTQASIVAAILASEPPPISTIQPLSPPGLDRLVRVCLAKDPDERFQSVHDLKLQLKWVAEGGSQAGVPAPVAARRKNRERVLIAALALCGILAIAGIAGTLLFSRRAERMRQVVRAQIAAPEHYSLTSINFSNYIAISPDGSAVAFIAEGENKRFLWVRLLHAAAPQALVGTEGASYPFWSPDSKFIGFFASGKMKKVEASGGVVQTICDAPYGRGGTWNRDGLILFAPGIHDPIFKVPEGGGQPVAVTKANRPGPFAGARWPFFLPDGRHFLYAGVDGDDPHSKVYAASIDNMEPKLLLEENTNAVYANGYLFFTKDVNLVAQPFDPDKLALSGNPTAIAPGIEYVSTKSLGDFSVSENGILAYRDSFVTPSRLVWLDRSGKELSTLGEAGFYNAARMSNDDNTVVLARQDSVDAAKEDLWLLDTHRATMSRLTFHPATFYSAAWSHDSRSLAVVSLGTKVQVIAANGSGTPTDVSQETLSRVTDWSPDGRTLVLGQQNSRTGWDIDLLPLAAQPQPVQTLLGTPFDEQGGKFSPDGRWLAYISNESGRAEIYVVPFPGVGGRRQISNTGAATDFAGITWSHDGKQIYYRDSSGTLMVVDIQFPGSELRAGVPRQFFSALGGVRPVNQTADGRLLVMVPVQQGVVPPISMIMNWDAELKK